MYNIYDYFNNLNWRTNMVQLRDIASILRAPLFKDEAGNPSERYSIISIKDFPLAGYIPAPKKEILVHTGNERINKFIVQEHDVLLTIVGTIGKVTIVPEGIRNNCVPATNMLRFRFTANPRENSIALYVFLKSTVGQATIQSYIHGSSIPIVTKGQIASMRIPAPSSETWSVTEEIWCNEQRLYMEAQSLLEESQRVFSIYSEEKKVENPYLISS